MPSVEKPDRDMLVTYKLPPRTIQVIEELAQEQYDGDAGQAITARVKVLKMKKIE